MGNLLQTQSSFVWHDNDLNRLVDLNNLNACLTSAREAKDKVYCPVATFDWAPGGESIYNFLWDEGINYDSFRARYPWMMPDEFNLLFTFPSILNHSTPDNSKTWNEFSQEFRGENNTMVGFPEVNAAYPLIYDNLTWHNFHRKYVTSFSYEQRKKNYEYFKKHFVPNFIGNRAAISKGLINTPFYKVIERIDPPKQTAEGVLHGEQIHVHFKRSVKCALNLDGVWKHEDKSFTIPVAIRELCVSGVLNCL